MRADINLARSWAAHNACCSSRRPASHSFVLLTSPPYRALEAPLHWSRACVPHLFQLQSLFFAGASLLWWSMGEVRAFSGFASGLRGLAFWKSFCSSSRGRAMPYPLSGPFPSYSIPAYFPYCLWLLDPPHPTHMPSFGRNRKSGEFAVPFALASGLPSGTSYVLPAGD